MRKIYIFLINSGKFLFIFSILLVVSISLNSLTIKGKVSYGERCNSNYDEKILKGFEYQGVSLKDCYLECNTYYLTFNSEINEEKNILFLASLSKFLSDKDIQSDIHVIVKNDNYQLLATIINYQISYTKTIY